MSTRAKANVIAIVCAAGRSRRMGSPKQLMDVAGRPMLLDVLDSVLRSAASAVIVVTHSEIAGHLDVLDQSDITVVLNNDAQSEMIDSVRLGLAASISRFGFQGCAGYLVMPGDHPGITAKDVDKCIETFTVHPEHIVVASFEGRRGHPIIFPRAHVSFVLSAACDAGLRELPRAHTAVVTTVPCASRAVIRDVDTPEDYGRLQ